MILLAKEDNSKKKLIENIKKELEFINSSLEMQKNLSTQVLKHFKEMATDIDVNNDTENMELYFIKSNKVNEVLKISNENITEYEILLKEIQDLNNNSSSLKISELVDSINEYNGVYRNSSDKITINTSKIENFLKEATPEFQNITLKEDIETIGQTLDNISKNAENEKKEVNKNLKSLSELNLDIDFSGSKEIIENTLIISEQEQTVILPYTVKELKHIVNANNDKYTDIYDVIDKLYTKPIKYYKNAPVARFREAYKLAKDKENMSFKGALDLAFECFFNSALHPAIISSCQNLNQLDVYLSCLEYNELEDFYFFDIIYKIPPLKQSRTDKLQF